ncbi:YciI-like protein [Anditalea andensis]|uniref:YCII-related domain-containing protein n=1 Tax=Anditalea andensis TaxID=1048983 RepID=A0A074L2C1_9BACT|nr:YciI-like protein [Anditalea andensis]KEO74595.1 hypothetical protein EL17_02660 [Anditalea andensis]
MSYYVLFYKTVDDYIVRRIPYREEHLRLAEEARIKGDLVMAGALSDPADEALLIFQCESTDVVEEFAKNDPYVRNGLISEWKVRPWAVVIKQ